MFRWFKTQKKSPPPIEPLRSEDFTNATPIYHFFTNLTGIHFHQKEATTTPKLIRFAKGHNCFSFEELIEKLRVDLSVREDLINLLTVNETYFFREKGQLDFLARRSRTLSTPLRILCAPGSTGEEAYSIAIILAEYKIALSNIEIVSIDINTEATQRGRAGVYTNRALHRLPDEIKERYFLVDNDSYCVEESLKRCVRFSSCNIFEKEFVELGVFDIIFSRNMLIYFDPHTVEKAVQQLKKAARDDQSLFFFGHADLIITPSVLEAHFEEGIKYYTLKKV
ncbi:MAG: CheR family methyltransferase [Sulfurimonas sp.]